MPVVIGDAAENGFANPIGLLSDCHRRIERFLKTLEAVAGESGVLDAQCRKALQTALEYFRSAAPKHTADEEEDLFPMLRLGERPEMRKRWNGSKATMLARPPGIARSKRFSSAGSARSVFPRRRRPGSRNF